jgi:DNA polymerase III subunit gamma/tau
MMATTELHKIPDTIQSRSQVFELKTIGAKQIADQLRAIAAAEGITIDERRADARRTGGRGQHARRAERLRPGDRVRRHDHHGRRRDDGAGAGGRDLLFDIAEAVAQEDAAAGFALAGQAVESGHDLRSVIRELARLTRDLVLVSVDPSRATDPEIAAEGERERIVALAARFSHEDLMRAFDLLTKADFDIRGSAHPRYHLEMALLRWIHLRKLVPLSDLIQGIDSGAPAAPRGGGSPSAPPRPASVTPAARPGPASRPPLPAPPSRSAAGPAIAAPAPPPAAAASRTAAPADAANAEPVAPGKLKEAFLEEVRRVKKFFHGTVVAQAQKIELEADRVVFTFGPHHRHLRAQFEQNRTLLEDTASRLAGRRMAVVAVEGVAAAPARPDAPRAEQAPDRQAALKQQALEDSGVQAMLDVFAAEIKDVEER